MEDIAKPTKINFEEGENENEGIITIEPCYPGYGTTLGNALRRVLLSSLSGAAVTGVKIEGATHEFTTLPHVKEDILDIILNLKKLRVKVHSEEEIKLELNAHGEKEVKAKDISKNSQVEIINPDLTLAHITDMAGSLKMEIYVNQGRGYRPVEAVKKDDKETGFIDMDAIFSPILSTGINIENVRVGKMTNWDKLILNIVTDGTMTPKEAFEKSVKVLVDQFSSLTEGEKKEKTKKKEEKDVKDKGSEEKQEKTEKEKKTTTAKTKKKESAAEKKESAAKAKTSSKTAKKSEGKNK
jgi:DNA-directed RNA polymerase subunit alpha